MLERRKPLNPSTLISFSTLIICFSFLIHYIFFVSFLLSSFCFSPSQINALLCLHVSSVLMNASTLYFFCPHYVAFLLSFLPPLTLCLESSSPKGCLTLVKSMATPFLVLSWQCVLYQFLLFFLFLICRGHILYSMWYLISDMYDRVRISEFLARLCFAFQMRSGKMLHMQACVFMPLHQR